MTAQAQRRLTPEEYLELDRAAEVRSEFFDGVMYAMAGATWNHNVISSNVAAALNARFAGRTCRAVSENMRVQIDLTGRYAYPDVVALCSAPQFKDAHRDVLLNPELIVEVLSDSTKQYDRGAKFLRYRTIASLQEYVLISQEDPVIMRYNRQPDGTWLVTFIHGADAGLDFLSVGCSVPLVEVYRDVEFPSVPAAATDNGA